MLGHTLSELNQLLLLTPQPVKLILLAKVAIHEKQILQHTLNQIYHIASKIVYQGNPSMFQLFPLYLFIIFPFYLVRVFWKRGERKGGETQKGEGVGGWGCQVQGKAIALQCPVITCKLKLRCIEIVDDIITSPIGSTKVTQVQTKLKFFIQNQKKKKKTLRDSIKTLIHLR